MSTTTSRGHHVSVRLAERPICRLDPSRSVISRNARGEDCNFGGGVNFGAIYVELRYHYIWGPTVSPTGPSQPLPGVSSERKANGQFLATTFGLRF